MKFAQLWKEGIETLTPSLDLVGGIKEASMALDETIKAQL